MVRLNGFEAAFLSLGYENQDRPKKLPTTQTNATMTKRIKKFTMLRSSEPYNGLGVLSKANRTEPRHLAGLSQRPAAVGSSSAKGTVL